MARAIRVAVAVAIVAATSGCAGGTRSPSAGVPSPAVTSPTASPGGTGRPPGLPASPRPSSTMRCLTGTSHFSVDEERVTDELCLTAGAVVDLPPRAGSWTAVRSSDSAVVACAVSQGVARCRAVAPGRATVSGTDGSGTWQLTVFVS